MMLMLERGLDFVAKVLGGVGVHRGLGGEVVREYVVQSCAIVAPLFGSVGGDPRDRIKVCHLLLVLRMVVPDEPGLARGGDEARLVRMGPPVHGEVNGARQIQAAGSYAPRQAELEHGLDGLEDHVPVLLGQHVAHDAALVLVVGLAEVRGRAHADVADKEQRAALVFGAEAGGNFARHGHLEDFDLGV